MNAPSAQRTGFVKGTPVWTKNGIRNIEQVTAGDWVLSRPEDPNQGVETGYKRVTKTFSFDNKEIIRFWWAKNSESEFEDSESVYATPNQLVWLNPHGWVFMGRLHLPGKMRPGTVMRGEDGWLGRELVLAHDNTTAAMLDVMDLFQTDNSEIAFEEEDDIDWGGLVDFSGSKPNFLPEELEFDYENWSDNETNKPVRYLSKVYTLEVEDWHTYFVGKMGLWVKST